MKRKKRNIRMGRMRISGEVWGGRGRKRGERGIRKR